MDKKIYAVFKKDKVLIDDFIRLDLEKAIDEGKTNFIIKDKKYKLSDFIRFSEEESENYYEKAQKEFLNNIKSRLSMSPSLRAENTRGHFSLWFWSVFGENLSDKVWEKVLPAIKKYYEKNNVPYPSLLFYFEIIPKAKDRKANEHAFRLLERVEGAYFGGVDNYVLTKIKHDV